MGVELIYSRQSPCWSVLEFWKIKLEKSSSTNWIFSLQKSISKLIFAGYTGSKNPVWIRLQIQSVELDLSNLIFQNSSTDQQGDCLLYISSTPSLVAFQTKRLISLVWSSVEKSVGKKVSSQHHDAYINILQTSETPSPQSIVLPTKPGTDRESPGSLQNFEFPAEIEFAKSCDTIRERRLLV